MALDPLEPSKNMKKAIFGSLRFGKAFANSRPNLIDDIIWFFHGYSLGVITLSDRELRRYIQWLRSNDLEGSKICSSPRGGYFLGNKDEVKEFLGRERSRGINIIEGTNNQWNMYKVACSGENVQLDLIPGF